MNAPTWEIVDETHNKTDCTGRVAAKCDGLTVNVVLLCRHELY